MHDFASSGRMETVIKDNPSMTCRMENGRNPIRVVLDTNLKTPKDSKIYIAH